MYGPLGNSLVFFFPRFLMFIRKTTLTVSLGVYNVLQATDEDFGLDKDQVSLSLHYPSC